MLKPYHEMVQVDVLPRCDYREAKDDNGKKIKVPYLNWATCKSMLHENGAETVYFTPLKTLEGSYLFTSADVANKDGRKTGCWFVSVEVHIDDLVFTMDMPLMNGSLVVYEDTLNQLRISNAHARAFVKGVAIHTGLGFNLCGHSIWSIKERIERLITAKEKAGLDHRDLLSTLNLNDKQFRTLMLQFNNIATLEQKLQQL